MPQLFSLLGFLAAFLFGAIAIFLSIKEDKTKKAALKKDREREDFTHMVIHELRAPLSAIKDSSELMISNSGSLDRNEQEQYLRIIHDQAKVLLGQIGSLLDAAKLEAGKFTVNPIKGDIVSVIKERMIAFQPQAKRKQIQLTLETKEPLPPFFFDPIRIGQAINNLLSNSIRFTGIGGKVILRAFENEKNIHVSVFDNGIEVPKSEQKNLFSKFSQGSNIPSELAKEGSGLGLYVVKGIIEAHGGTVSIESNPGEGTTISFTLPATDAVEKSDTDPKPNPSPLSKLSGTVN